MSYTPNQHLGFIELKNASKNRVNCKLLNGKVEHSSLSCGQKARRWVEYSTASDQVLVHVEIISRLVTERLIPCTMTDGGSTVPLPMRTWLKLSAPGLRSVFTIQANSV